MLDPATGPTGTKQYLNVQGSSFEGLHNDSYGAYLNSVVEAAALATIVPGSTPAFAYPSYQNRFVAKSAGTASSYSGTLTGVMVAQIAAIHSTFPSGGQFEICYLLLCAVDNGSGVLVSNGVPEPDTVGGSLTGAAGTIDYITGAWTIAYNGGSGKPPINSRIIAYGEPIETAAGGRIKTGNLLENGQMDYANIAALTPTGGTLSTIASAGCNTANLGSPNSNYVPAGWTLAGNSNDQTALAAGTLVLTCGYGIAPDGNPGFFVSVVGNTGASTSLTLAQNVSSSASFVSSGDIGVAPDITRASIRMSYVVGPSGHLYGARSPSYKQSNTVSNLGPVLGTQCPTTNCSIMAGVASGYSGTVSLSKLDLQQYGGTAHSLDLVTPPANADNDVEPNILVTSGVSATFSGIGGSTPMDYRVWFQNAAERITTK
jgi:hypothetical protein